MYSILAHTVLAVSIGPERRLSMPHLSRMPTYADSHLIGLSTTMCHQTKRQHRRPHQIWLATLQDHLHQFTVSKMTVHTLAGLDRSHHPINNTVSQKNDTDVAHYNFHAGQPILIIFGSDVAERECHQTVICYPTSPN